MKKILYIAAGLVFLITSCNTVPELKYFKLAGLAQGTSYHVTYGVPDSIDYQEQIDSLLRDFDLSLSSYDSASIISRVNRNEKVELDEKFQDVFAVARHVNEKSGGAFDITIMPLVNAWGFGPGLKSDIEPEVIDSLLQFVGMDKVYIEDNYLVKENPGISIDVNAIAQGYSVDLVALYLEKQGIENYMVEIGGEVKTKGLNPKGEIWKIGIDRPVYGNVIPGLQMQAIIKLNEKALATSGNYRKFYEDDGVKYSHSIDPKTGYPVKHSVLSATIIAENCMIADAYATACMVMGLEKSQELISGSEDLEAYIIYGDPEGQYQVWSSEGFKKYIVKESTEPVRK